MPEQDRTRLSAGTNTAVSNATSRRNEASHLFTVNGPVGRVFGLFDPVSECDWADDWHPVPVFPEELGRNEGSVFTIERDGRTAVWTVLRYSAEQHVAEYLVCENGYQHRWIYVSCSAESDEKTKVMVRYVTTALSPEGQADLGRYGEDFLQAWQEPVQVATDQLAA